MFFYFTVFNASTYNMRLNVTHAHARITFFPPSINYEEPDEAPFIFANFNKSVIVNGFSTSSLVLLI